MPRGFCPGLAAGLGLMGGAGLSSSPDFRSVKQELGRVLNVLNYMLMFFCENTVSLAQSTSI